LKERVSLELESRRPRACRVGILVQRYAFLYIERDIRFALQIKSIRILSSGEFKIKREKVRKCNDI
jgi:hypothetical protein